MLERRAEVVEGHDKLLEANNREVERRHAAEGKLRTAQDVIRLKQATINRFTQALTPSANTKGEYGEEFKLECHDGEPYGSYSVIDGPWTAIKDIMSVIRKHVGFA
jgi:hypothetical protein